MTSRVEPRPQGKAPGVQARPGRLAALAPLALLFLTACGGEERFPMTSLAPKSDFAREIDGLFRLTLYMGVGVGILVFVAMGYILYRFRYRPGGPDPEHVHGNTTLEFTWTLIPAILIAIIAVPTVRVIFSTQPEPPEDALVIDVIGWQWWWEFRYPLENGDTVITANEIHVPTGRTVHLRMTGGDVIHSFWVPQMGGKRDLIPNRVNSIVMTPEVPGVYMGACAEFCGESHALMQMRMIAHPPGGFEQWLRDEARPAVEPVDSAVMIGRQLATQGSCAGCHAIRGTGAEFGRAGPDLTHFARRRTLAAGIMQNNAENLATWLRDPPAVKPGSLMPNLDLSEEEIGYLVAYMQTLY